MKKEIIIMEGPPLARDIQVGGFIFTLDRNESAQICGYHDFDYDRVCICPPGHNFPHFVITGQAQAAYPDLRVMKVSKA